ncbi:MAG: alkaline phosphatase family protein [Bacillota bacterium]
MAFAKWILSLASMLLMVLTIPWRALALPPVINEVKPEVQPKTRQIVLIVVDGLQAVAVNTARTPNMNGIGMAGVKAERVSVMPPDSTESRLYTLLCGSDPEECEKPGEGSISRRCPTLLSQLEKKGIKTAVIDGTGQMESAAADVANRLLGPFRNDGEVIDKAVDLMKKKKPFLTVVVLSGPGRGPLDHDSNEYVSAVTAADNQVGRFLKQLHIEGSFEETLLVITGTTGRPPLIIKGRDFLAGVKIPPVCMKDLAPTLGYLFGANMSESKGQVLWNALKPGADRNESFMLQQRVMDLSLAYAEAIESAARLESEKIAVQQEKTRLAGEKQTVENEMAQRDGEIRKLNNIISIMKIAGLVGIFVFVAAMLLEYRILKKKYLFFT